MATMNCGMDEYDVIYALELRFNENAKVMAFAKEHLDDVMADADERICDLEDEYDDSDTRNDLIVEAFEDICRAHGFNPED